MLLKVPRCVNVTHQLRENIFKLGRQHADENNIGSVHNLLIGASDLLAAAVYDHKEGSHEEGVQRTEHRDGCAAASFALLAALRGDSSTDSTAAVPVHSPVTIASAIAPVPTNPILLIAHQLMPVRQACWLLMGQDGGTPAHAQHCTTAVVSYTRVREYP